jgi:hypothetical protein
MVTTELITFMKQLWVKFNASFANLRSLPDFIILGAQKAGTSSLFYYLKQHPQIKMSLFREVHFFDNNYHKGEKWYRSHFPLLSKGFQNIVVGEASPYYLIHPHAPRRIHEIIPSCRLIILLRNPIDRAISHYFHSVRNKKENLPIYEAMIIEETRINDEWKRMLNDENYHSLVHPVFSYKQRGVYVDQIKRYLEFFNMDQIHIINSEELFDNPTSSLNDIYDFLVISKLENKINLKAKNVGSYPPKKTDEVIEYLMDYFEPHNQRLFDLLGKIYSW